MILGSGGSTSAAPKPSNEDPAGVTDVDAHAAEEMADSMLRDSPIPETEEERKQAEDIPAGKSVMSLPPNSNFSRLFGFLLKEFFPRSSQSRGS